MFIGPNDVRRERIYINFMVEYMRPINKRRIPTEVHRVKPENAVPIRPFKFA